MTSDELWDGLVRGLAEDGVSEQEWKQYSKKFPPTLRLLQRGRAIVYLTRNDDGICASFILGDAAIEEARGLGLPCEGKKYVEGTLVHVPVACAADIDTVRRLAAVKSQSYSRQTVFSNWRAITSLWISLVPSPIVHSLTSR